MSNEAQQGRERIYNSASSRERRAEERRLANEPRHQVSRAQFAERDEFGARHRAETVKLAQASRPSTSRASTSAM